MAAVGDHTFLIEKSEELEVAKSLHELTLDQIKDVNGALRARAVQYPALSLAVGRRMLELLEVERCILEEPEDSEWRRLLHELHMRHPEDAWVRQMAGMSVVHCPSQFCMQSMPPGTLQAAAFYAECVDGLPADDRITVLTAAALVSDPLSAERFCRRAAELDEWSQLTVKALIRALLTANQAQQAPKEKQIELTRLLLANCMLEQLVGQFDTLGPHVAVENLDMTMLEGIGAWLQDAPVVEEAGRFFEAAGALAEGRGLLHQALGMYRQALGKRRTDEAVTGITRVSMQLGCEWETGSLLLGGVIGAAPALRLLGVHVARIEHESGAAIEGLQEQVTQLKELVEQSGRFVTKEELMEELRATHDGLEQGQQRLATDVAALGDYRQGGFEAIHAQLKEAESQFRARLREMSKELVESSSKLDRRLLQVEEAPTVRWEGGPLYYSLSVSNAEKSVIGYVSKNGFYANSGLGCDAEPPPTSLERLVRKSRSPSPKEPFAQRMSPRVGGRRFLDR